MNIITNEISVIGFKHRKNINNLLNIFICVIMYQLPIWIYLFIVPYAYIYMCLCAYKYIYVCMCISIYVCACIYLKILQSNGVHYTILYMYIIYLYHIILYYTFISLYLILIQFNILDCLYFIPCPTVTF